jgi:hypothetical protein
MGESGILAQRVPDRQQALLQFAEAVAGSAGDHRQGYRSIAMAALWQTEKRIPIPHCTAEAAARMRLSGAGRKFR